MEYKYECKKCGNKYLIDESEFNTPAYPGILFCRCRNPLEQVNEQEEGFNEQDREFDKERLKIFLEAYNKHRGI